NHPFCSVRHRSLLGLRRLLRQLRYTPHAVRVHTNCFTNLTLRHALGRHLKNEYILQSCQYLPLNIFFHHDPPHFDLPFWACFRISERRTFTVFDVEPIMVAISDGPKPALSKIAICCFCFIDSKLISSSAFKVFSNALSLASSATHPPI